MRIGIFSNLQIYVVWMGLIMIIALLHFCVHVLIHFSFNCSYSWSCLYMYLFIVHVANVLVVYMKIYLQEQVADRRFCGVVEQHVRDDGDVCKVHDHYVSLFLPLSLCLSPVSCCLWSISLPSSSILPKKNI
jgi:hypothetical protein